MGALQQGRPDVGAIVEARLAFFGLKGSDAAVVACGPAALMACAEAGGPCVAAAAAVMLNSDPSLRLHNLLTPPPAA